ncbi:MAG: 1-acyl-sn-glycerol-3-phosphate acyltransferase [Acidobacteria bacterium]|nr:1-acyl-sn-glycerol-3-phosphate acyltransferase [Acidobacteriota bacterium]TDI49618.1 MAG: 1-acyl-sn-glycerol-3-phosphate acyltransferase [Acidobacteriota bacterium]TDI56810.1 MAG: 1-acyl-sn-glycerol-3-phosphate acyltransferase [Acidobacteriota bacterium]
MRPPSRWVRRLLIDPGFVVGMAVVALSLPVVLVVVAFLSRYVPGKWRPLRIIWFLFLYLVVDVVAVVGLFLLWIVSGFGWRIRSPGFQKAHYRLFGWMLRRVVASAKFTFKVKTVPEGEIPRTAGEGRSRPILILSRHAGPGDSLLVMDGLYNRFGRQPRIVLKEFLQWDPAIDIMLNRLPSAFVPATGRAGNPVIEAIEAMTASMDVNDAFVIFPEGGNYTIKRHLRAIQKLREIGRPDLAERAESLKNTLPPKPKGVMTALAAAPGKTDVFFIGHSGLETLVSFGDIWRGMPMGTQVAIKAWYFPAERIPPPEEQETWLYDIWGEIDSWITEKLSDTAEPFDDHDEYH